VGLKVTSRAWNYVLCFPADLASISVDFRYFRRMAPTLYGPKQRTRRLRAHKHKQASRWAIEASKMLGMFAQTAKNRDRNSDRHLE